MIKEKSCGAVVYKTINGNRYYLIEHMKVGHYSIPKGHVENTETERETALREIKEETNLKVILDTNFRKVIGYTPYEGCYKDVVFFVAEVEGGEEHNQEMEVASILWLSLEEALNILTYDTDRMVIKDANDYLTKKENPKVKKILTIQDISCVGQCSLTVAMPIISAFGIETCILPSAILSTHTGGFKNFTFRDLTEDLPKIAEHWKNEKITFDGIYTGYIGSTKQIDYIKNIIYNFKDKAKIICVDPAMADNGKLYYGFDNDFVKNMATLCGMADYIVPNITEACFLLNRPYLKDYQQKDIEMLLKELATLGAKNIVLTGISFNKRELGVASYNTITKEINYYFQNIIPMNFHGTGDIFASAFFGSLIRDFSLQDSLKIAVDFTVDSIKETIDDAKKHWYGVHFEAALPSLINRINKK